jgi:hypothetical protein
VFATAFIVIGAVLRRSHPDQEACQNVYSARLVARPRCIESGTGLSPGNQADAGRWYELGAKTWNTPTGLIVNKLPLLVFSVRHSHS